MSGSGRRRTGLRVAGLVGLAVVVGGILVTRGGRRVPARPAVLYNEQTPLPALGEGLREGDGRALAALSQRMTARAEAPATALGDAEAAQWLDVLAGLRTGFLKFGGYGRASAMVVTTQVLNRFAVEPAPECWLKAVAPVHDLFASGLEDPDLNVRVAAMVEVSKLWTWMPGRSLIAIEGDYLADKQDELIAPVKRRLSDREPGARVAAVACLGALPLDKAAAPAIPYLEDPSVEVRQQVLVSFARRPDLLSTDVILKKLYDPEVAVSQLAETVLKARGLSTEQIDLARLLHHPKPELRASLIPLLRQRTGDDIDLAVWLIQLSQDHEESVRLAAVAAMAERPVPEVRGRLAEMASTDQSPAVREAVARVASPATRTAANLPLPLPRPRREREKAAPARPEAETTVALPPLPGSPSLNPKAN